MRASSIIRISLLVVAFSFCFSNELLSVRAQDVGADVGGGAGIFRPKNPETRKRTGRPPVNTRRTTGPRTTAPTNGEIEDRIDELLEKGNQMRDARRFAEAEDSYQGILKLKPHDGRAAYGLGNIYADQQRWDEAEAAYRNAVAWAPADVDALVALSVVLDRKSVV